jgi:basic membrane lipoprotein Med (substrate-binding protein (PBP1-ABC) superfamily)
MMRRVAMLFLVVAFAAAAANPPDFSGTWIFNAGKSKNVGMMASAEHTSTITQTAKVLSVTDVTVFSEQKQTHETRYDLSGATVLNDSPMGDKSQTNSHWSGNKLVTSWESEGAVAGTKVVRTETRYLSDDGKTLFLESARAGKEPMVIVFDRK